MKWLNKIPLPLLLFIAIFLGMAPFPAEPQPHLLEKLGMLANGLLIKPVDIFDLFLHGTPLVILLIRITRLVINSSQNTTTVD